VGAVGSRYETYTFYSGSTGVGKNR